MSVKWWKIAERFIRRLKESGMLSIPQAALRSGVAVVVGIS